MADRYAPTGGQAVIEGVMMRSPKRVATAVRLPDGTVSVKTREYVSLSRRFPFLGLPILRGAVVLIESLRIGVDTRRAGEIALHVVWTPGLHLLLDHSFDERPEIDITRIKLQRVGADSREHE